MIGHPLKVHELLSEIEKSQVLLPEIQRTYVWKGPQVTRLMDSLYREYPVGQILLWDPKDLVLPVTKRIEGSKKATLPSFGPAKIVLDGQQRLTSLYKALGTTDDPINVYFNLATEEFQLHQRRLKGDPRWVSVREVVNGTADDLELLEAIEKAGGPGLREPEGKLYHRRLQDLRQVARYEFPIEIFVSDDYDQVTELFVRINSAGTRLREAELALAQLALRLPGTIVETFEVAMEEYERLDYDLDTRFLVRALIAIGTGQSRFRHLGTFWNKPVKELEVIWKRTRRAVDTTVNFARHNARFESSDWLPSVNALIPLVMYFDRYNKVTPNVQVELLRWFYTASLRGRYSGSTETALDEDIKAVTTLDSPIPELIKNALAGGRSGDVAADEFDDAGQISALFALTYAAAKKRSAVDWFSGIPIGKDVAGEEHQVEIHHIFPKKVLKDIGGVKRKDRDEIANLAFLAAKPNKTISARRPDEYLAEIAKAHPERLESQCIPMDRELWTPERFQDFLAARRTLLAGSLNKMLASPA